MPVKLNASSQGKNAEELSSLKTDTFTNFEGDIGSFSMNPSMVGALELDKATVKKMVAAYRTIHRIDPYCLKFIHFNLKEILTLFVNNEVIDPTKSINDQLSGLDSKGCKIYLGNHFDETTCPINPNPSKQNPYLYMDTAIICNTQLDVTSRTWRDLLKDNPPVPSNITILGAGDGLDRGSICPPNCPGMADPDGYFHEDILP